MSARILVSLLVLGLSSCLDTDCCIPRITNDNEIAKGLYLERYTTFCAGVWGEMTECYITDSISFRQKIGSYDEHEFLHVSVSGDTIIAYNVAHYSISDTIERKFISKSELLKFHQVDSNCIRTKPLFGVNSLSCDSDYYPTSGYKTDDGYFMSNVQFKCGNQYSNAIFYTDSLSFSVFLGIYIPGSSENLFSVAQKNKDSFVFYNITNRPEIDTVKSKLYSLAALKKGTLVDVCKKKK